MPIQLQVVSGPIGAGKSSILRAIDACTQYDPNVVVVLENTDEWQYYLERFYRDPAGYVFLLQKEVESYIHRLTKRLEQLDDSSEEITVFVERSPLDVLCVFLPLNCDIMDEKDLECLTYSLQKYADRPVWQRAKYFLVSCPPRICMERIVHRKREGEEQITAEYIGRVVNLYDEMARRVGAQTVNNYGRQNSLLSSVNIVSHSLQSPA